MNRMLIFAVLLVPSFSLLALTHTPTGIALDEAWKKSLNDYAVKNVVHPSWGYSHSERNYHNTKWISDLEGLGIDEDVLFAAAFLHDLGGLPGFEKEGVDHGLRSAELGLPLLRSWGFPEEKLALVEEIIIGHVYYGPKPLHPWARAFRDADILDFLGAMGVSRILAANSEMGASSEIKNSIGVLGNLVKKLPAELIYRSSQNEGKRRVSEMQRFLETLEGYSFGGQAY